MRKPILLLLSLLFTLSLLAQTRPPNLPHYDEKTIHFGFLLGYNQFSSLLKVKEPLPQPDKVVGMNIDSQHGFQVGVISDLKIFEYLRIRLIPTISFGERKFNFNTIDAAGNIKTESTNIEAIYLETPLEFKIQSKRWRDFRPYVIAGGKHAYDLASLKKKSRKAKLPLKSILKSIFVHLLVETLREIYGMDYKNTLLSLILGRLIYGLRFPYHCHK